VQENLETYKEINAYGTAFSIPYFISLICRLIFNLQSRKKLPYDIWLIADVLAGITNITAFNVIGKADPEDFLSEDTKWVLDYFMIGVLIISWLRFFSYFLVITSISRITMSMLEIINQTIAFMMIFGCYFALMITIFATLFSAP
jgi:hypothetical protein